jgi:hypothetical protein
MSEPARDDRLLAWGLATFHAAGFVLLLVTLLHVAGGLGSALGSLNTVVGLGLYAVLWVTAWWAARQAVRGLRLAEPDRPIAGWELLGRGFLWGGVNGAVFWLVLLALLVIQSLAGGTTRDPVSLGLALVSFLVLFLGIGVGVAFAVGGLVGLLFATVDWTALALAHALWRAGAAGQWTEPAVPARAGEGDGHGSVS